MVDPLTGLFEGLSPLQITLAVLVLSIGLAVVVELLVLRLARSVVRETESRFDNIVLDELRLPIVVTVALSGVWIISQSPAAAEGIVDAATLQRFFGRPAVTVVVLSWAWALNRIVNRFVAHVVDSGNYDFAPVFSNVWTILVTAGVLFAVLRLWRIEITPLLGAAGIAGIAVGFAAKDTVANFFGGMALYFDDTYTIGDFVELQEGDAGAVVRVGIRSTTLQTRDETLVTVPNSMLNATRIANHSAPQRRKRTSVRVSVAYGTDVDRLEDLRVEVASEEPLVLDSPKPRARFDSYGASAVEYELFAWIGSPNREPQARHELNRAVYQRLREAGVDIPFPQRTLRVEDASAPVSGLEE
jgi:small-conductance mechanosensitive channel